MSFSELYQKKLQALSLISQKRSLPKKEGLPPPHLDFSTNDYLDLAYHPHLVNKADFYAREYGVGATGSRLLSGNPPFYEAFEQRIAQDKKTESALLFNSGFQANAFALSILLDQKILGSRRPLVFFDRLNHASLYQAIFLSGAELIRYPHLDLEALKEKLERHRDEKRPTFIVSETLFGMDGDLLDRIHLEKLRDLAATYACFLYLDDAHAMGVLGPSGYGLSGEVDLSTIDFCVMSTFSKGLGCFGAALACSHLVKDLLINTSPGLIYTTALPPPVIGVAFEAWQLLPSLDEARHNLQTQAKSLRQTLGQEGWSTGTSATHLIPLIIGPDNARVLDLQAQLVSQGIRLAALRSPTVPKNTARLKIALRASHTPSHIETLLNALKSL